MGQERARRGRWMRGEVEQETVSPPLARSLDAALGMMSVLGVLLAALELALIAPTVAVAWPAGLFPAVAVVWFFAGTIAWRRRPGSRIGLLIWMGGLATLAGGIGNAEEPTAALVGTVFATVILAVVVHLLLAFPSGRLPDRTSRVVVAAAYVVAIVLQAPLYIGGGALASYGVPSDPTLATIGRAVQAVVGIGVMVATAVVLISRLRGTSSSRRRVLMPLYGYGIVSVLLIPTIPRLGLPDYAGPALQLMLIAGIAVAFTVGVMFGGFERTAELEELAVWLGSEQSGIEPLRAAIARALGDPSVELVYWLPVRGDFVDGRGVSVDLPSTDGRDSVVIESAGEPVGAILYDAHLLPDQARVRAVGRVAAIAVARERLATELRASQTALRRSSARIVAAEGSERVRIADDRHDEA